MYFLRVALSKIPDLSAINNHNLWVISNHSRLDAQYLCIVNEFDLVDFVFLWILADLCNSRIFAVTYYDKALDLQGLNIVNLSSSQNLPN